MADLKESVTDGPIPPECQALVRLGETGAQPAAVLGRLLSALPRDVSAAVEVDGGVRLTLSAGSEAFVGDLPALLFAPEPSQVSGLLFKTLWSFAEAGVPLNIQVATAGQPTRQISLSLEDVSAEELLAALREVFEVWDLAGLYPRRQEAMR